jgi:hypothetical protein
MENARAGQGYRPALEKCHRMARWHFCQEIHAMLLNASPGEDERRRPPIADELDNHIEGIEREPS